jgi:hypothetical protein
MTKQSSDAASHHKEQNEETAPAEAEGTSEHEDEECYDMDTVGVIAPKYQAILCSGDDEDDEPPRRMLGYAAYRGPKFIPAEVKDNVEHFLANNRMPTFLQKWFGDAFLGNNHDNDGNNNRRRHSDGY